MIELSDQEISRVSLEDVCKDFARVARIADRTGAAIIMRDNVPRYVLMPYQDNAPDHLAEDEELQAVSARIIDRNRRAYEVLAG